MQHDLVAAARVALAAAIVATTAVAAGCGQKGPLKPPPDRVPLAAPLPASAPPLALPSPDTAPARIRAPAASLPSNATR